MKKSTSYRNVISHVLSKWNINNIFIYCTYLCAQRVSCCYYYSTLKEQTSQTLPSAPASMLITNQRLVPLRKVQSPQQPAHG